MTALGSAVRAVVFDFDGTLFHLPVDVAGMRVELGLAPTDPIGPALQQYADDGDDEKLAVVTRFERDSVLAGDLAPGAPQTLARLRTRYRVAILTRNSRLAVLDALGSLVDGVPIVGREDVRRLKPDPEGLHLALRHLDARPAESALVGDTYHDVEAAHAAGLRSIVVHNPKLAYAPKGADAYVDTLTELVEATTPDAQASSTGRR